MTVGHEAAAKETSAKTLARLHGLHSQVCPHGFGNRIEVLARLETLLGQGLDLGASVVLQY